MSQITTILFDFDGVISDTEPQYDIFFDEIGVRYNLGTDHFASYVKGVPLPEIIEKFFNNHSKEEQENVVKETQDFELQMNYSFIPGANEFILYLKEHQYKIGLVTSSQDKKMKVALEKMNLTQTFDTLVTADRITRGKPDPMCYLLAANDLGVLPAECVVFEDSIPGITSGKAAGMKVIGLTTTSSQEKISELTNKQIPDFKDISLIEKMIQE